MNKPDLARLEPLRAGGKVSEVIGLTIKVSGLALPVGEVCLIPTRSGPMVQGEVVGFKEGQTMLMPLGELEGISPGDAVWPTGRSFEVPVGDVLLGQVLDGLGRPLSGEELKVPFSRPVSALPPNPLRRKRIEQPLVTGIKAIDGLLTCGLGQRVGIFAGSGVGKSTLLGMIARHSDAEVNVIGLIGERGREVLDFLEKDLGEGLKKSVVVAATSDQPALVRIRGAFVATAIAEYFRDQGKKVLLMMDSLTRFATAQREVGLAIGEPPATKGYPPSVFALLPRLLERAGQDREGSITGLFTVLVDGDDFNEPIADAVRSILDGHIVLSRDLAAKNQYPAIDISASVSRLMPQIVTEKQQELAATLREALAVYSEMEDLINIGAYKRGSNARADWAIKLREPILNFLKQESSAYYSLEETITQLALAVDRLSEA